MDDLIRILVRVLIIVLIGAVPTWLASRRSRKQFQNRFGRQASEQELDSLGAWLKDPPTKAAQPPVQQSASSQSSIKTSYGNDPRA